MFEKEFFAMVLAAVHFVCSVHKYTQQKKKNIYIFISSKFGPRKAN